MTVKPDAYTIRSFVEDLKRKHPEQIIEIEDDVSIDYEPTAYYLSLRKRNPVLVFKNLVGFKNFSIVTNIFGSEERLAMLSGLSSIREVIEKWSGIANGIPTENLVFNNQRDSFRALTSDKDLNLFNLPIPSHFEMDGSRRGFSRYITSGLTTTIDPENEDVINLSFARIQPFEKKKFAFDAGSRGHLWKYLNISKERRERMKMTILVGPNPIFYLLAASFIDNEFRKASKILNVEFSRGHKNDIPIPTDTEIAIEAEFLPGETFEEGPFAEYAGYMGYDSTKFVAEVKSILIKRDPIYYDIQPSNSSEHVNLFSIPRSSIVMKSILAALPKVSDYQVVWPHYGGRFISFGYVVNPEPGLAKQLGISILGHDPLWNKVVFVNEGQTELTMEASLVNLAQSGEFSEKEIARVSNSYIISSDPTRDESGNSGKIVFVTRGRSPKIKREVMDDHVIISTSNGNVLITHKEVMEEQKVNVVVSDDIDITDEEQIGWAIATRLNPDKDIKIERNKITFLARRKVPSVAHVPENVKEKIEKRVTSLSGRFH
ncbi:MAG: UbiD family decarboxylase [Candidatus Thermoplasmatota archaeon]|nr:UbiD family decarboxylase [Candidatus Thermoplasmatota archaeon]MCL6002210.1 UbiD family decarboxylase [Candidatus Thermoplasmatota archaeon]